MNHFKFSEFDSPDLPNSGRDYMNREFLEKLDYARSISNVPFIINSGFRTSSHNKKVGGKEKIVDEFGKVISKGSSHLYGLAVDISCKNSRQRIEIVKSLIEAQFTRLGIAKSFVHCDLDPDKNPPIWLY